VRDGGGRPGAGDGLVRIRPAAQGSSR
jgi:hypothetical protein